MNYHFNTVTRQLLGDLHTPVSMYLKLRDLYPESVLLESSDYHGNENSLSYIALNPVARISMNNHEATFDFPDGTAEQHPLTEAFDVADALNQFMAHFEITGELSAHCGLFGYTAFDAVRYMENIPVMEHHHEITDAPEILYLLYKYIIVFDHFKNKLTIIELTAPDEKSGLDRIETLIENRNFPSYNFQTVGERTSTTSDEEYRAMVREGIELCKQGEIQQIVLSRRFEQGFHGDDFKVYRTLRRINPSPYLFYFDFGGFRIFGSSPETHCKVKGRTAIIDPIAGTAFRSGDDAEDQKRVDALMADPKENIEHDMLVELAMQDLNRNAHDVTVKFFKERQWYSHVIHLVSRVCGTINDDSNPIRTLMDTFPAGTVSGAPKVRTLELITELEKHNRGGYGGCIGFIGFNGDLNQAIMIRTFISRDHTLFYQAGAGIVAQSNDERELQEVNSKLNALNVAIREAENLIN
ncbi:MAG: anthranilate synthase component I family protein [Tannerella sp.]|jgi:anthranilate synthase component 1|nr:anthranilate synthase component I family protein [Tannerella sp.]